jgi:hypothetical protein
LLNEATLFNQWLLKQFSLELKPKFEVHQEQFFEVFSFPTLYSESSFVDKKLSYSLTPDNFSPSSPEFYPQISIDNYFIHSKPYLFDRLSYYFSLHLFFQNFFFLSIHNIY